MALAPARGAGASKDVDELRSPRRVFLATSSEEIEVDVLAFCRGLAAGA